MKKAAASAKTFIVLVLWAGAACVTLAQNANVAQAPPTIEFEQWREVSRSEFYKVYQAAFPSAVTTGYPENDRVRLTVYMPTETFGRIPVVLLLHFWGATDDRIEQSIAARLAEAGVASVLMPLPYHLSRTPAGKSSGEMAVVPDIGRLRANTVQSVLDVRRTVDWIESRPEFRPDQIGIAGTSLGAMVSALAYALEPRFAASCFLLGGVDIAHILWHSSRVVSQREGLRRQGYTEERVRTELAAVEPLNYLRKDDQRPSLVIAAKFDTVVPAADAEKLIGALGSPQAIWLDTGHYGGALVQAKLVRTVAQYFSSTFRGSGFKAPSTLYAPTIRWGIGLNDDTGLQVMVGIDVWRLRSDGETFGTVLVTPRGGQGFVGHTLSKNLAVGVTVTAKRTTLGLLWSVVL